MASAALSVANSSVHVSNNKGSFSEFTGLRTSSAVPFRVGRKTNDDLLSLVAFQTSIAYSKDPRQLHTPTMVTKGCLVQATGTLDVQELQLSTLCQPQLVHLRLWPLSFPASRVNSMALTYVSPLPMYRSWTLSFKYQRRHLQRKRMLHSGSLLTRSLLAFSPSAMSHLFHLTLDALIFHQLCIVHLPWSCEMTWLSLLLGMTMNGVSHREWLISLTLLPTNGYENAIIY
ncbi:hypothetical protein AABB24_023457 [Solanum stoloniferum]|uniref:Uncharacterized protein n=1 Tax=Solanum stoloniferum TaxID=62892 RepID=A0ABD2SJI1_9SOLN